MIASQLGHLTGLPVPHGSVLAQLGYVFAHLPEINLTTMIMAAALLVLLFVGTRLLPRLPWTLRCCWLQPSQALGTWSATVFSSSARFLPAGPGCHCLT